MFLQLTATNHTVLQQKKLSTVIDLNSSGLTVHVMLLYG